MEFHLFASIVENYKPIFLSNSLENDENNNEIRHNNLEPSITREHIEDKATEDNEDDDNKAEATENNEDDDDYKEETDEDAVEEDEVEATDKDDDEDKETDEDTTEDEDNDDYKETTDNEAEDNEAEDNEAEVEDEDATEDNEAEVEDEDATEDKEDEIVEEQMDTREDTSVEQIEKMDTNEDEKQKKGKKHKKRNKKRRKRDDEIQNIFEELIEQMNTEEDLPTQLLKYLKELNWHNNLPEEDIKRLQPLYDKICEEICKIPKISDILSLSMPYDEQCEIIEKILILYNAQPNTFEFLQLKNHLNKLIEKYKHFNLTDKEYEKYKAMEQTLTLTEKKFKPLKYQILDADMSNSNKSYLFQRYKYFASLDNSNSEYNKLKNWMDVALSLPNKMKPMNISSSDSSHKINKYLWTVKNMLDKEIYGLQSVKEKILFLLNNRITNNKSKGLSFALCGPPGTGKTSIVNILSKAIELPFFQINLGGAKDISFLSGHGYTYEGAVPGVITQAMISLKYKNGIIYFDEFDKISNTLHGMEISRMLLHITDFSQNDKFHDRYLSSNIDIDLSNIWFIYSLNDQDLLDKTLSDRIPIIHIPGYTKKEKIHIVQNHIISKALENIGLKQKDVIFTEEAIKYLIEIADKSNKAEKNQSGVRAVKHLIENLLMKINLLKTKSNNKKKSKYVIDLSYELTDFKLPITITKKVIDELKIDQYNENISNLHMYL